MSLPQRSAVSVAVALAVAQALGFSSPTRAQEAAAGDVEELD